MNLASGNAMTINKLTETANRITDVGTVVISFISRPTEDGDIRSFIWEEVAATLQTQERTPPNFLLCGIEEVGTIRVGVPVFMANHLQNNRQTKRASVGTMSNLVQIPESATMLSGKRWC